MTASSRAIHLLASALALVIACDVPAQTLAEFHYLTTDDGLPHMNVAAVYQDSLGFMWFATNIGVVRWDGYKFKTLHMIRRYGWNPSAGMPTWIGGGIGGEILVGGWDGLDRVGSDGKMASVLVPYDHVPWGVASSYGVTGVYVGPSEPQVYWVGTYGSGLFRLDRSTDSVTVFLPDPDDPNLGVSIPVEDLNGSLWVPTDVGLYRLQRPDMTFHRATKEDVVAVEVDSLQPDVLWLSEVSGLSRFDVVSGRRERVLDYLDADGQPPSPTPLMTGSLIWDRKARGVLWIAANTAGLYRYDTISGDVEHYPRYHPPGHRGSTPSGSPSSVFQDRGGVIWVGTRSAGVNYAEPVSKYSVGINTRRRVDSAYPTFVGGYVSAIAEDGKGRWWIGNRDPNRRHLLMLDRSTGEQRRWFHTRSATGEPAEQLGEIFSLLEDRHGNIWIAAQHVEYSDTTATSTGTRDSGIGAIHRLDPETGAFKSYRHNPDEPVALPAGGVWSLHEDGDGIIWAGIYHGGIARIDPETHEISTIDIGDYSNTGWGFLEDSEGRLWVGTKEGVCLIDRESRSCELSPLPVELPLNTTYLAERAAEPGIIWVGTWKGLFRFDPRSRTFTRPVASGPLTSAHIVALVADKESALWMSTDGDGVYRYDPATGSVSLLEDRMPYYSIGAGMLDSSGDVVFGSQGRGIRIFDPHADFPDPRPPVVLVTGLYSPRGGLLELVGPNDLEEIRLSRAGSSFSVDYVALDYSNSHANQYAYRLEGLQDGWQYVGGTRRATFGSLSPGTYTFRVKASNSHGVWNETGDSLRIVIPPPWWRTWWAHALYSLLVVAGIIAAERVRHRTIVRREQHRAALREREIRSEVAEEKAANTTEHARRLEELGRAKSRFFANVSHEFRTPLTLILGVTEDAAMGRFGQLSESLAAAVELITRNARHVERLVRELLDLSRLESGTMRLAPSRAELSGIVNDVVRNAVPLAERAGLKLNAQVPAEPVRAFVDVAKIRTALGNLITNAVKFTESGGRVEVSLQIVQGVDGYVARIDVGDTGIGISGDDIPHIFDRFSQVDTAPTRETEGIGIGLALVREIVELHGGRVGVDSELGVGSTFTIELPLRRVDGEWEVTGTYGEVDAAPAGHRDVRVPAEEPAEVEDVRVSGGIPTAATETMAQKQTAHLAPTVLIVEDNADVRNFLRGHLQPDFRVLEAQDGEEGLRMTCERRPDLVISDIMMPKMDGIDLCRAIKGDPGLRTTPVILLTARAGEAEALEGLRAGADEYVTKPFSVARLVQLAANMVRSRAEMRAEAGTTITVVPSQIDGASQDEELLGRVARVVEDHLGDAYFTVDMLSDEVGLSRRQLERRLPDVCGESPSELVRRMRLERARQLLEADVGTVAEITYASGYRSASRFASAFRKAYGLTPSEYRQSVNGNGST